MDFSFVVLGCIGGHPFCDALTDAAIAAAVAGIVASVIGAVVGWVVAARTHKDPKALAQAWVFWVGSALSFVVSVSALGYYLGITAPTERTTAAIVTVVYLFWFGIIFRTSWYVFVSSAQGSAASLLGAILGMLGGLVGLSGTAMRFWHLSAADDWIGVATLILMGAGALVCIALLTSGPVLPAPTPPQTSPAWQTRGFVTLVEVIYLLALFALAIAYTSDPTSAFHVNLPSLLGSLPIGVAWFGALGAVIISLSGTFDHRNDWDPSWSFWHFTRPLIGISVAIISCLIFQAGILAASPGAGPNIENRGATMANGTPSNVLYYLIAFVVGYREEIFRSLVKRVADVILTPPAAQLLNRLRRVRRGLRTNRRPRVDRRTRASPSGATFPLS